MLLSPGLEFNETDDSLNSPAVPSATAAYAGVFQKGPIDVPVLITRDKTFEEIFGEATDDNYEHWYTVWNYLQYASSIYVKRAYNSGTSKNAGLAVKNSAAVTNALYTIVLDDVVPSPGIAGEDITSDNADAGTATIVSINELTKTMVVTISAGTFAVGDTVSNDTPAAVGDIVSITRTTGMYLKLFTDDVDGIADVVIGDRITSNNVVPAAGIVVAKGTVSAGNYYLVIHMSYGKIAGTNNITVDPDDDAVVLTIDTVAEYELDTAAFSTLLIDAETTKDALTPGSDEKYQIVAKSHGVHGNDIKVAIAGKNQTIFTMTNDQNGTVFDSVLPRKLTTDELGVVVLSSDDTVLEKFIVSYTPGTKNDSGQVYFIEDYINANSKYIYVFNNTAGSADFLSVPDVYMEATALAGGVDGTLIGADIETAYGAFADKELYEISFLIGGANTSTSNRNYIVALADTRKDCMAIVDCESTDVVGSSLTNSQRLDNLYGASGYYESTGVILESKYCEAQTNWKFQTDKFKQAGRWIPMSGDVAGIKARTASEYYPWTPAWGPRRGQIKNAIKLAWNPGKEDRDALYVHRLNPICTIRGQGTMLYGERVCTSITSAINRGHVRMLLIYIERSLSKVLPFFIAEQNTQFNRNQMKQVTDGLMDDIEAKGGVEDPNGGAGYKTVCDSTNNTPTNIDNLEAHLGLYLKPTKAIENIYVNMIITRSGASFEETVTR